MQTRFRALGILLCATLLAAGCGKSKEPDALPALPDPGAGPLEVRQSGTDAGSGASVARISTNTAGFDLKVDPQLVKLTQDGKVTLKLAALRKGYEGPIAVELTNLPLQVTCPKATIAAGANDVEIELTAGKNAAVGDKKDVTAVASAAATKVVSAPFTVSVAGATTVSLFELKVNPSSLQVEKGGQAKLQLNIVRKDYAGPIVVELSNLPAQVTAAKVTIPAGKNKGTAVVSAAAGATVALTKSVTAIGSVVDAGNKTVLSSTFSINVVAATASSAPFSLRVQPAIAKLKPGGKAQVTVTVTRQGSYTGAIALELRNLPAKVSASKVTVASGQNTAQIDVTAAANSTVGDTSVNVVGTPSDDKKLSTVTASLTVRVQGKAANPTTVVATTGSFDLKVAPTSLRLKAGGRGKVHVTVVRKGGFAAPIAVEIGNVPPFLLARPGVIPAGQNSVDIEIAAAPMIPATAKAELLIVGRAAAGTVMQAQNAPRVSVTVTRK